MPRDSGSHLTEVTDEFVDWMSICGPPEKCIARLRTLVELGLDHVYILGGSPVANPHGERQAGMIQQTKLFAEKVMPAFR